MKRFPALFRRKPTQHTSKSPSFVSYAPEVLTDDVGSPAVQPGFPASFAATKAHTNEVSIESPAEGSIISSDMMSSNAVGFVEMAFKSACGHQHGAPACNLLARANEQTCLQNQLTHTFFASTSFSTGIGITWEVFGDETGVGRSTVVVASHVVKSDDGNDVDIFLSFVFNPSTAVDAIIQYGDGESTHEVVLERFRLTAGGKAIPLQSWYNAAVSASSKTETPTNANGK